MQQYPKALIYGSGYIGLKLLRAFKGATLGTADIAVGRQVDCELERIQPDVVINCAGRTGTPNIDWCERNRRSTWYSNAIGAQTLGLACKHRQAHLVHLSSGCVFQSDHAKQVWQEHDRPHAFNFYTESKLYAEQALRDCPAAIVRIRLPMDWAQHDRNLLTKLQGFRFVTRSLNSVTILDDLVAAIKILIKHRATGNFHCVSPQPTRLSIIKSLISRHALGCEDFVVVNSSDLARLNLVKTKRSDAILGIDRLLDLGFSPEPTQSALERVIAQFNQHSQSFISQPEFAYAS